MSGETAAVDRLRPGTRIAAERSVWTLKHRKADDSGWWNTDKSGFADEALRDGLANGSLVILDEPPDRGELPEVAYVKGTSVPDALRSLADQFDADDDLVLIGLWNVESESDPILLQVVVTHLTSEQFGRTAEVES